MINQYLLLLLFILAFVAANLPWLSDKCFCFITIAKKTAWIRWFEWLAWYLVALAVGLSFEYKSMGTLSSQDWEFYVVTLCLFVVFALPGFIYCHDLKKLLKKV